MPAFRFKRRQNDGSAHVQLTGAFYAQLNAKSVSIWAFGARCRFGGLHSFILLSASFSGAPRALITGGLYGSS